MEEYRLEMEIKLGNEQRTIRGKWQPESAREDGAAVGADTCTQPGVRADRLGDSTDSQQSTGGSSAPFIL